MNGYMMYELARERIADQHRAAERRLAARQVAASRKEQAARGRHAGQQAAGVPTIPDFVEELLDAMASDAVPGRGRRARTTC